MDSVQGVIAHRPGPGAAVRERIALEVVEPSGARGLVVPCHRDGSALYRGLGESDYACGGCGHLIATGVRPGMFRSLVFACRCGALNQVL
jgi:hypothetical protein